MTNEIKEILEKPNVYSFNDECYLYFGDYNKLKDYITNLQEENERLKEYYFGNVSKYEELIEKYSNLQDRINKAIELLKDAGCYDEETKTFCDDVWDELPELLEILQGEYNE